MPVYSNLQRTKRALGDMKRLVTESRTFTPYVRHSTGLVPPLTLQEQHRKQTLEYNLRIREQYTKSTRARMSMWDAMEMLNTLVDESDPDTSVGQIEHLLQTAEAIRRDGKPDWMQLTGLVHDLGKLLCFFGAEGQWDVVGDTFVVGCKFSEKIIYPETFKVNPDYNDEKLMTENGIYQEGCGMDNVILSWGHDEYLYHVCKTQSTREYLRRSFVYFIIKWLLLLRDTDLSVPKEALSMIRYHSFYPWHREGAYRQFMTPGDEEQLRAVKAFNRMCHLSVCQHLSSHDSAYDLYSKSDNPPSVEELKPYYMSLIKKYFPDELNW
jgi:inositol oxygenase